MIFGIQTNSTQPLVVMSWMVSFYLVDQTSKENLQLSPDAVSLQLFFALQPQPMQTNNLHDETECVPCKDNASTK
jgi:hypothetical protein